MSNYAAALHATKEFYPFARWAESSEVLEQYTDENCGQAVAIFDRLIERLIALDQGASEQEKLGAFQKAVQALNDLDEENGNMLIESGERDELCDLTNRIATAAGLDPRNYADGEGPASLWRDW
jgi:hypothetical protein